MQSNKFVMNIQTPFHIPYSWRLGVLMGVTSIRSNSIDVFSAATPSALLLEGPVFDLECLSVHRGPSDGVRHRPGDCMSLSWVSSCGCVLLRCVQQATACRGESLRKERGRQKCPGISMFYTHVSEDHVDLAALLNKDVLRLHIFAHRPPLWVLKPKERMHTISLIPNETLVAGSYASPKKSCQIKLIVCLVLCESASGYYSDEKQLIRWKPTPTPMTIFQNELCHVEHKHVTM